MKNKSLKFFIMVIFLVLVLIFFSCGKAAEESQIPENLPKEEISGTGVNAEIYIDKNGLPYVEARSTKDAMFAAGYITAKMRYAQIDILRVVSNALVSSLLDVEQARLADSLTIRTLMNPQTGKLVNYLQWEKLKENDPTLAELLQAFVDGINFYIKRLEEGKEILPPEYESILSPRNPQKNPGKFYLTPPEILAIARFEEWYLTGDEDLTFSVIRSRIKRKVSEDIFEKVFSEILTARAGVDIFTLPAPSFRLPAISFILSYFDFFLGVKSRGSNNFVISPSLAVKPIVANDPHLPLLNPPLWFPMRARAGSMYLEGFSLVGIPGILSGTNGSVAWGVTNAGYDSLDLYLEKVALSQNCESGFRFIHNPQTDSDDSCVEVSEYSIGNRKVKFPYCKVHGVILGKKEDVLEGKVGVEPLLEDGKEYISFRWIGQEISSEIFYFLKILESKSVDEFMRTITGFEVAPINFVFADLEGNIGYGTFALLPDRNWDLRKYPPTEILPTDGCCDWKSWIPKEKFPHVKNPQKGFITTANNDLPGYTKDGDPFNDPIYLFWSYDPGYRVAEITHMIREKAKETGNKISFEQAREIMEDTVSFWTRMVFPKIITFIEGPENVLDIIRNWDMTCRSGFKLDDPSELSFSEISDPSVRKNSAGCSIWWVFVSKLINNTFADEFFSYLDEELDPFLEDYFIKNLYFYFVYGDKKYDFFDNITTPEKETVSDIVKKSFQESIEYLSERFGANPENWLWGKLNKMKLYHAVSQAGLSLFDIGPFPIDLGPLAPAVAWVSLVSLDFINTGGPSFRSVAMPEGDRFKIRFAFPGGVAGFGFADGEKNLKKPDIQNNFNDLIYTYFGGNYISFEEDKTKHKKVIVLR